MNTLIATGFVVSLLPLFLWVVVRCCRALYFIRVRRSYISGMIICHPRWRGWLRRQGLRSPKDFLSLPGLIISGHPGRHVARVKLGTGSAARTAYLKCEEPVALRTRFLHLLCGEGWTSLALREARRLQELEHHGLPAPRWLAVGEDEQGQAFLLMEDVHQRVTTEDQGDLLDCAVLSLPVWLRQRSEYERRRLARQVGRELAALHGQGYVHTDLYAKHVLVGREGLIFLDWQRARALRGQRTLAVHEIARDLATLFATLPDVLAGPRVCLTLLAAYRRYSQGEQTSSIAHLCECVHRQTQRLLRRRHVLEKRQLAIHDLPPQTQSWVRLDGLGLCASPALLRAYGPDGLQWLRFEYQASYQASSQASFQASYSSHVRQPSNSGFANVTRRWLILPDGQPALLMRRRSRRVWNLNYGSSPEERSSVLLLRLGRCGVKAPVVLAKGERKTAGQWDSFLLTTPPTQTLMLRVGMERLRLRPSRDRQRAFQAVGSLVRHLEEAGAEFQGDPVAVLGLEHLENYEHIRATVLLPDGLILPFTKGIGRARLWYSFVRWRWRHGRLLDQLVQRLRHLGCDSEELAWLRSAHADHSDLPDHLNHAETVHGGARHDPHE